MIAVAPIGRLGNVMGEYASIFALKELFNVSAVLTISHKTTVEEYFPRLSLPVVEMGELTLFGIKWHRRLSVCLPWKCFRHRYLSVNCRVILVCIGN